MTTTFPTKASWCAIAIAVATLAGCGDKEPEKKPTQSLAVVNGKDITTLQLNEELMRANVAPQQQQAARKQLVQALVDRQLIVSAAEEEKLDRDPKVVQAVERAKALILAQAYIQKKVGTPVQPTAQEIETYYNANPQFFAHRKQFSMDQLSIQASAMSDEVKAAADSAKSLDEMAAWLESKKIPFQRGQNMRTSADMPSELSGRLAAIPPGQLFIVKEPARALFITLTDVREAPVSLASASPQIEQFLMNKKTTELAKSEVARLRKTAKIEYMNGMEPDKAATTAAAAPTTAAAPAAPASDATARGIQGL